MGDTSRGLGDMDIRGLIGRVPIEIIVAKDFVLKGNGRYRRGVEHNSLVIDLQKNLFYWNSIGVVGNALDWLTKIKGLSYRDSLGVMQKYSGLPFTNIIDKLEIPVPIYPKLLNTFFKLGTSHREYWYRRGLTNSTIEHFKLGYTGKAQVIPIVNDGILMNFQCRIGHGAEKKVWAWSRNRPTYPFNVDGRNTEYTIMTEGLTDALAMHQIGLPVISQSGGSSTWKAEWNKYIIGYNMVYLLYDNDIAGTKGAYKVGGKLLNRAYIMHWPASFSYKYDVNNLMQEYGEEVARELIVQVLMPNAIHISELGTSRKNNMISRANLVSTIRNRMDGEVRELLNGRAARVL